MYDVNEKHLKTFRNKITSYIFTSIRHFAIGLLTSIPKNLYIIAKCFFEIRSCNVLPFTYCKGLFKDEIVLAINTKHCHMLTLKTITIHLETATDARKGCQDSLTVH